ncbi:MAG: glycosyltransferase family 4 protein, partial [Patescibacteria group bacterium]|nr:glycosyltransferase family 4 protein [Patescibacteria group bacterium]
IIAGIYAFHDSIGSITRVLFVVSCLNFFLTCALHFLQRNGRFVLANLIDLFDVFLPLFDRKKKIDPSKKRILIMNWRDTRHKFAGGAEVYVHELAKRWVKEGHSVTLFCGNDSESLRNEVIDGMQIIRRGGFYFVYVWAFVYYFTKFRGCYDVIIDCHNGIPFFTPLYVKERVICVVHQVHQDVFLAHLTLPFAFLARVLENRLMPLVYKDIEFVAVSSSTKDDMIRWGILGKGIHIIPNGIDDNLYVPSSKSKAPFIVYVGRLKYYKSVNIFIHAAVSVHKKFPRAKFVIAGDGEERRGLQNLVEQLGATSFIEFKGKVSEQEKIFLYQQAWVFVNPSRIEGWGLTTIEANACGTPVVASRVSGLCDSVIDGKSGILVDYGDIDGFSDAICLLIRDKKLRQRMEAFSVDWAKKFRWDDSARLFMDVISGRFVNDSMKNETIFFHPVQTIAL